jgi:hypothetical protein
MGTDYKSAPAIEGKRHGLQIRASDRGTRARITNPRQRSREMGTDYKSAPAIEGNGTDYKSAPAILHYFITSTLILKSEIGHVFSIGISLPT